MVERRIVDAVAGVQFSIRPPFIVDILDAPWYNYVMQTDLIKNKQSQPLLEDDTTPLIDKWVIFILTPSISDISIQVFENEQQAQAEIDEFVYECEHIGGKPGVKWPDGKCEKIVSMFPMPKTHDSIYPLLKPIAITG